MHIERLAAYVATAMLLSACGGGGGSNPPTDTGQQSGGTSGGSTGGTSGSGTGTGTGTGTTTDPGTTPTTTQHVAMIMALPGPPGGMQLWSLNDNGHAAGIATTGSFPMSVSTQNYHVANADNFYQGNGTAFPTTVAGNNNSGVIAGLASPAGERPFAYTWDGASLTRIRQPDDAHKVLGVAGIDDSGRIAASVAELSGANPQAAMYADGFFWTFPRMGRNGEASSALAVSYNGKLVANLRDATTNEIYLGVWDYPAGQTQAIRKFLNYDWTGCRCVVKRVTNQGDILLMSGSSPGGATWPMIVNANESIPLPGAVNSTMMDMNDARQVVGGVSGKPVFWENGTLNDLNAYAESAKLGWKFITAERINNNGQVLGRGTYNRQERWYLMTLR